MNYVKKINNCQCCGEYAGFELKYLRGIGDSKTSRACPECADKYFEEVKSQYFAEEYKGNSIYKWNGFYFPYWDAQYAYENLEDCRARIDDSNVAIFNKDVFNMIKKMQL